MKSSLLLIAALSGGVTGLGASLLTSGRSGEPRPRPVPSPTESAQREIEELRSASARLEERLRLLESQMALAESRRESAVVSSPVEAAWDQQAIQDLLTALNRPDRPAPPGLARIVEQVVDDKRAREEAEREEARRAERQQRLDERLDKLALELGLDPNQKKAVRKVISERDEAREALFRSLREGGLGGDLNREGIRASMQEINAKADQALQASLTPSQYADYKKQFSGSFRGFSQRPAIPRQQ